jgi:hypothetical protein
MRRNLELLRDDLHRFAFEVETAQRVAASRPKARQRFRNRETYGDRVRQ